MKPLLKYYVSGPKMTVQVNVDPETTVIMWGAPVVSTFVRKREPLRNLVRWMRADVVEQIDSPSNEVP